MLIQASQPKKLFFKESRRDFSLVTRRHSFYICH